MGFFKVFGKKDMIEEKGWMARTGDTEVLIDPEHFVAFIDDVLTEVEQGEAEFLVLKPPRPVDRTAFLQVCQDNEEDYLHIEVGLDRKTREGRVKILACDHLTTGEVHDIILAYYNDAFIDTSGWYAL